MLVLAILEDERTEEIRKRKGFVIEAESLNASCCQLPG
jgi:hypothetical protein